MLRKLRIVACLSLVALVANAIKLTWQWSQIPTEAIVYGPMVNVWAGTAVMGLPLVLFLISGYRQHSAEFPVGDPPVDPAHQELSSADNPYLGIILTLCSA